LEVTDHAHLRLVPDRSAEDIARAVAFIAGVREGHPPAHVERVAEVAASIAEHAGLDAATCSRCVVGAWLHDIGMVALPDDVLAPSDPSGYVDSPLVRAHVVLGAELVTRVAELAGAADAVRHHHERYDGSGYPDGLAGEQIPPGALVVAVCDAYDAMVSDRPYRSAMPREAALRELRDGVGTQFDAAVVEAFAAVLAAARVPA
jgi:response regulator RpfG family c-di-GMP phosphodiesterase